MPGFYNWTIVGCHCSGKGASRNANLGIFLDGKVKTRISPPFIFNQLS